MEEAPTCVFPKLNVFVTRIIMEFTDPSVRFSVFGHVSKKAREAAYDCSVLKEILYGRDEQKLTYDADDYIDAFFKALTKKEELRILMFHYYFHGDPFPSGTLFSLPKFVNVEELHFPEARMTEKDLTKFEKCTFPRCVYFRMPLVSSQEFGSKLLKKIPTIFPKLEGLHFEDINTDKCSFTEKCQEDLCAIKGLKKFHMRMHEDSTPDSMRQIIDVIGPGLKALSLNSLSLDKEPHMNILKEFLATSKGVTDLNIINEAPTTDISCEEWGITTLTRLQLDRVTSDYTNLCKWMEQNQELEFFRQKYPYLALEPHEARIFRLSFMPNLRRINLEGVFKEISFEKLPALTYLRIDMNKSKIKIKSRSDGTIGLEHLNIEVLDESQIFFIRGMKCNWPFIHYLKMENVDYEEPLEFPRLFELRTTSERLVNSMIEGGQSYLRVLDFIYPKKDDPEYFEDLLPRLAKIKELSKLSLDYRHYEEKSTGSIEVGLPNLVYLAIFNCKMMDDRIIITKEAKNLETIILMDGSKKEIIIDAPNIKHVAIKFFNSLKSVKISAMNAYTLHYRSCAMMIRDTPGVGKLFCEYQRNDDEFEMKQENYYPFLTYIKFEGLQRYWHTFWRSLSVTAPNLKELIQQFYSWVDFKDETDRVLRIEHPNLEFVTLRCGEDYFDTVKICKEAKNLKTLKFRDFDFKEFDNEGNKRYWSEKNLLNDQHFE